jgi:hypothetical protein
MKKFRGFFIFAFSLVLLANLASAYNYPSYYYSSRDIFDNIITAGAPILELLFGGYTESIGEFSSGEILFIKLLIFILMFVIIQVILKNMPFFEDNLTVIGILSVAIPLIAIRFMSANNLIYGIMLPYGVLGVALTTILPLIIFFFFVHNTTLHKTGRRIWWIFFLIIYLVLWLNRTDQISDLGNQIYSWVIVALIINIFLDGRIHAYIGLNTLKSIMHDKNGENLRELITKLEKLDKFVNEHPNSKKQYKAERKYLIKRIEELGGSQYIA